MIKSVANKVTSFLFSSDCIDINRYEGELDKYKVFKTSVWIILGVFGMSIVFDKFIHSIVFMSCYKPLSKLCGGYNIDNSREYIFKFLFMYVVTIFIGTTLDNIGLRDIVLLFAVLNWLNICFIVPIRYVNEILSNKKRKKQKFKIISVATLVLLFVVFCSKYYSIYEYSVYGALALFWINMKVTLN
ncbi:MAG: accessory gene regulator B family protein [Peptostreptococcaceae bacterium]